MRIYRNSGPQHKQRGVTLIEQIMVLVIVAALTGMAIPPLRQLLGRNQLQVAQTDFIIALQHAREAAITTGKSTVFCPTRNGTSCSDDARWDSGWLLSHDTDHNDQPDHGPLYSGSDYAGKLTIQSSSGRHYRALPSRRECQRQQHHAGVLPALQRGARTERGGLQCRPRPRCSGQRQPGRRLCANELTAISHRRKAKSRQSAGL